MSAPDFACSMVAAAHITATNPTTFRSVMKFIQEGRWATSVREVREAYERGGKDAAAEPKRRLPGVLFSGIFSRRAADGVTKHSGLICVDLDGLNGSTDATKELICSDPHTLAAFVSPTGSGLKAVFRCDPTKPHAENYHAAERFVLTSFGLQIDQACKDVSRLCFVSHDPEAFVAEDAVPLPYPEPTPVDYHPPTLNLDLRPGDDYDGRHDLAGLLLKHGWSRCPGGFTRPGKTSGLSATFDKVPGRLHVFTDNAAPLLPNHNYKPWHVYAIMEHGGDFSAAAKALAGQGYGQPSRQQQNLDRVAGPAVPEPPDVALARRLALLARRVKVSAPPPEPVIRLFLADKPICTPGNITTITSKAKTGKTAALGAATAAVIAAASGTSALSDTFKFRAANPQGHAVIVFDTEQSPFDAYQCYQRSLKRAGTDQDPAWLHHYSLVGMSAKQLHEALDLSIEIALETHGGIFIVILDGVADFVNSVNDEAESNQFVTWLRERTVKNNCPALCVIHSNEGEKAGNDSRGHLGKQLIRKAESNLLLKKTGEVTTITSDKQRKAPITEADGVAFQWDEIQQCHVSCGNVADASKPGRRPKYDPDQMISCVPGPGDKPESVGMIHRKVGQLPCSIDIRTFKDWVAKWLQTGEVVRSGDAKTGFYFRRCS